MNIKKYIITSSLFIIVILLTFSCVEDDGKSDESNLMNIEFQASLEDWNAEELAVTRNTVNKIDTVETIPVCSDDGEEYILIASIESDTIQSVSTRGTGVVSNISGLNGKKIVTYAYINGDGVEDSVLIEGDNYEIKYSSSTSTYTWLPAGDKMLEWPSPTQVISFYGYIPVTGFKGFTKEDKTLSFEQNLIATSQTDLIIGATEPLNRLKDAVKNIGGVDEKQPVEITLRHALTAVEFKAAGDMPNATLKQIELIGFSKQGTFTFPMGAGTGTWTPGTDASTFKASSSDNLSVSLLNSSATLNSGSNTFLMIPQSMSNTKKLRLTVTYNGATKYLTASFNGLKAWEPGKKVTYTLTKKSTSGYYLYTSLYQNDGSQYAQVSNSFSFNIFSYKLTTTGTTVTKSAVPWRLYRWRPSGDWRNATASSTYADGNSRKITFSTNLYGAGGTSATAISGTHETNLYGYSGPRIEMATDMATQRGGADKSSAVDLSTRNNSVSGSTSTSMNTANCYIVNGSGWFKFPIVYGNGIKNGSNNTEAYSGYKDRSGNTITSPWIATSGLTAGLVYTEYEIYPEIRNVSIDGSYIFFEVYYNNNKLGPSWNRTIQIGTGKNSNRVLPGNAVIGLFSGTNLVWQWHIYLHNQAQEQRDLGYALYGELENLSSGTFYFDFRQVESSSMSASVTSTSPVCQGYINWSGHGVENGSRARALQYTWGSAYPNPGTASWGNSPTYTTTPASTTNLTEAKNTQSSRWKDNVKTIFDPCPFGYRVPSKTRWGKISIDPNSLFKNGWYAIDTNGGTEQKGILLSIPSDKTSYYYLSSTYESSKYYTIQINSEKKIGTATPSSAPTGLIHPVKE